MLLIEKDSQKAEDQSTSPNSENDFKELIDEIDKVLKQNSSNSETEEFCFPPPKKNRHIAVWKTSWGSSSLGKFTYS